MGRSSIDMKLLREEIAKRLDKLSVKEHTEVLNEVSNLVGVTSLSIEMAMKIVLDSREGI